MLRHFSLPPAPHSSPVWSPATSELLTSGSIPLQCLCLETKRLRCPHQVSNEVWGDVFTTMCIDPHVPHSQVQRDNPPSFRSALQQPPNIYPSPSFQKLAVLTVTPSSPLAPSTPQKCDYPVDLLTAKLSEHFSVPLKLDFIAELTAADHHSFPLLFTCPYTRPWGSKETLTEILCFLTYLPHSSQAFSWPGHCSHRFTFFCYQWNVPGLLSYILYACAQWTHVYYLSIHAIKPLWITFYIQILSEPLTSISKWTSFIPPTNTVEYFLCARKNAECKFIHLLINNGLHLQRAVCVQPGRKVTNARERNAERVLT